MEKLNTSYGQAAEPEIQQFINDNQALFKNKLMQSFLKTQEHRELLKRAILTNTTNAKRQLDNAFKDHHAEIRLISQLSNTVRREAIRYDQKRKQDCKRQQSILDQPITHDLNSDITNVEIWEDPRIKPLDETIVERDNKLENKVENPALYQAICSLTTKQKHIIEAAYVFEMTDTQIAAKDNVSQQAVTKTRNNVLAKLRRKLLEDKTML
ncbi:MULTISPECIES: sigma-70 family RNA polymerase sigma factor [Virgibacillus]|uniref:RNA polymerase sigma factor SigO n=1 Tax=Virgibacillus massiliensis TaxID=1462526 RepID=A0A024QCQ7_9BACI|nr:MULTISPECIES: sigma-70 family RNA polymerase sigma factor [Virgibacillus]EQB36628.1 hypothetical protein M948_16485 [Virgibacillus sp. CM-4]CDQ40328.1 RNA polymerase sigma factor SigO [Virgibacillus massiliensis]